MITKKTSLLFIILAITRAVSAQDLHLGIKGNANLTKSKGYNFYDKNSYGYNFGGFLSYNFTSIVGVQLEALYGRTNLRTNSVSENQSFGISGGKKKLNYMSFPLLVKIDAGSLFSVVAGPQFNSLRNTNKYQLNNGERAFDSKLRMSYVAGLDLGHFYFRYLWGNKNYNNIAFNSDLQNNQYQLGMRFQLF